MDHQFTEFLNTTNGFKFDDENFLSSYGQSTDLIHGTNHYGLDLDVLDIPFVPPNSDNFAPSTTTSYETESPDDDSDPVLKFLNQILVEEGLEKKPSMFLDPLALQAAEKSLYEVIGHRYPHSPYNLVNQKQDSPDSLFVNSSDYTNSSNTGSRSFVDPQWILDPGEYISSVEQAHIHDSSSNSYVQVGSQSSFKTGNTVNGDSKNQVNSLETTDLLQNMFSDKDSILQFQRGMEEANKFLPTSAKLVIDLDKYELPKKSEETTPATVVKVEKDEISYFSNGLKGRKHHHSDDEDLVERSSKQSAICTEEAELSEMFDRVLLCTNPRGEPVNCNGDDKSLAVQRNGKFHYDKSPAVLRNGKSRAVKNESSKGEPVDLRSLLISCAQSVASDDRRTAYEQLRQIKQYSSPTGDVHQRLANVFICGLEARLGGTGTELYLPLIKRKITAVEKLKAYHAYISVCPFKKIAIIFATLMIGFAAAKATTLHVVDFGIMYGFQWPMLIQHLAQREGGPPKLRITGIELPQPGFRPSERIEETGCRLRKYCERFGVPFEYQAIAIQNWETINIEDLKIKSSEILAVNCLFRFRQLLDETVAVDSPRDVVLNLIRKMKPDIFVNAVTIGSFSSPFFVTRFREALYHYSSLFDMFDATLASDNPHRPLFEQDFYGRDIMNIIACEGAERVERPETHKQWKARHMRAGFKQLPLNDKVMKKLRHKVATWYHKDFLIDEDGNWMLQGWKGRIIFACSCWVPHSNYGLLSTQL